MERDGHDVYDTVLRRKANAAGAKAATNPQEPLPPEWVARERAKMNMPPSHRYETGERDIDAFNRQRHLEGPDRRDPHRNAYSNPAEFYRHLYGAYQAGRAGQMRALETYPANTPFGQLLRRAFNDGARERQQWQNKGNGR